MNYRTIRTVAYIAGFLVKTIPTRSNIKKLYETDPQEASRQAHEHIKKAVNHILKINNIEITVNGLNNIPEGPCLYAGNHMSYFDIVVTEAIIPGGAGFVAKDSLKKIPGLRDWMPLIHCLFLDRSDMKEGLKTIFKGADYLKEGFSMFIFPEGTRCKEGQLGEFKGASLKMAQRAKVPVVPVALTGTPDIFENNSGLNIMPSKVSITFGQPILIHEMPRAEQKNAVNLLKDTIQADIAKANA